MPQRFARALKAAARRHLAGARAPLHPLDYKKRRPGGGRPGAASGLLPGRRQQPQSADPTEPEARRVPRAYAALGASELSAVHRPPARHRAPRSLLVLERQSGAAAGRGVRRRRLTGTTTRLARQQVIRLSEVQPTAASAWKSPSCQPATTDTRQRPDAQVAECIRFGAAAIRC
ncbi:MAG: hypothetical protein WKG07_20360 [Hymenobacter sp.]